MVWLVLHVADFVTPVKVDLAARTTGARVAHLPEVVLLAARMDVRRVDVGDGFPQLGRLGIGLEPLLRVTLEVGRVETVLLDAPDLGECCEVRLDPACTS